MNLSITRSASLCSESEERSWRELEIGISVARLLLGLIVRLAECPVSSADLSVGMTALGHGEKNSRRAYVFRTASDSCRRLAVPAHTSSAIRAAIRRLAPQ